MSEGVHLRDRSRRHVSSVSRSILSLSRAYAVGLVSSDVTTTRTHTCIPIGGKIGGEGVGIMSEPSGLSFVKLKFSFRRGKRSYLEPLFPLGDTLFGIKGYSN